MLSIVLLGMDLKGRQKNIDHLWLIVSALQFADCTMNPNHRLFEGLPFVIWLATCLSLVLRMRNEFLGTPLVALAVGFGMLLVTNFWVACSMLLPYCAVSVAVLAAEKFKEYSLEYLAELTTPAHQNQNEKPKDARMRLTSQRPELQKLPSDDESICETDDDLTIRISKGSFIEASDHMKSSNVPDEKLNSTVTDNGQPSILSCMIDSENGF